MPDNNDVSCAQTAEPIEVAFGLWSCGLGWMKGRTHCMGAHWRHLANTIEPIVYGGDSTLCQITLTTC